MTKSLCDPLNLLWPVCQPDLGRLREYELARLPTPDGRHILWAYGHVPYGWKGDLTGAVERQIERFAPGFGNIVLARGTAGPEQIAARNPNNVGGDIAGGACDRLGLLFRPIVTRIPYATPNPAIYLCSSATPPGPGVHGMSGHHAAQTALRRVFRVETEGDAP